MVSPVLQEHWYSGGFLVSEANAYGSRDSMVIANAGTADLQLDAGLVLQDISAGTAVITAGSNTGNGTLGSLTLGGSAQLGTYTATLKTVANPPLSAMSAAAVAGTNTGNGTCGAVTLSGTPKLGAYVAKFSSATAFGVTDPNGDTLASGTAGSAYSNGDLAFTITSGGTAFVSGDMFTITVSAAATAFGVSDPVGNSLPDGVVGTAYADLQLGFTLSQGATKFAAGDSFTIAVQPGDLQAASWTGTGVPSAILFNRAIIPASSSRKVTVIARNAEVNGAELQYDPAVTGSVSPTPATLYKVAADALAQKNIVLR
jgi:hypothetical protein